MEHCTCIIRQNFTKGRCINMPLIMAFDVTTLVVRPSAFDGLAASHASIIVDEMMKQQMHYPQAFGGADTTELLPQTHLFHLTDGTAGKFTDHRDRPR